jgi:hypothetical protein
MANKMLKDLMKEIDETTKDATVELESWGLGGGSAGLAFKTKSPFCTSNMQKH